MIPIICIVIMIIAPVVGFIVMKKIQPDRVKLYTIYAFSIAAIEIVVILYINFFLK